MPEQKIVSDMGSINWPQNRLQWDSGAKKPAAHTQQKLTQVTPWD